MVAVSNTIESTVVVVVVEEATTKWEGRGQ
jgi:hypothetical protein